MQGLLLVDKPADWTSFDVVNYVRRIVANAEGKKPKNVKVGHTGTLDPFATGLLVLLIGKEYTRRASELSKLDKTYEATMHLGVTSNTGDTEGELTVGSLDVPTIEAINAVLPQFTGLIQQVPPAYSAIKINGQRAYKLAREGKEVVIEPRPTTIDRLTVTSYSYPEVQLTTYVASGTYIRTLVQDIGYALGIGAYTTALRRTTVGKYDVKDAAVVTDLTPEYLLNTLITL